jgi:23S rRNA pseudouridine955/2504/2580 synthase
LQYPVLFEDEFILAVAKPAGMLVHETPARPGEVGLQESLEKTLKRKLTLFHRLDRETSGVVLLGKRRDIDAEMTQAFENKRVRKTYVAIVEGAWPGSITKVDQPLQKPGSDEPAKSAITTFRILARANGDTGAEMTVIECRPKTGRQHQIRLHCQMTGHAILGDPLYSKTREVVGGMRLHAASLEFIHPKTGAPTVIEAAIPETWREQLLARFTLTTALSRFLNQPT